MWQFTNYSLQLSSCIGFFLVRCVWFNGLMNVIFEMVKWSGYGYGYGSASSFRYSAI